MASVTKRPNKHKWVQWLDSDSKRKTLRLGVCNQRDAERHCTAVESILSAQAASQSVDMETARFLGELPQKLRTRYERLGLIQPQAQSVRPVCRLGEYMDLYFASLSQSAKESTQTFWGHTRSRLIEHFGRDRDLANITAADARAFSVWLSTQGNKRDKPKDDQGNDVQIGLAANTVRRRMGLCRQIFAQAIADGIITLNPFAGMAVTVRANKERQKYVDMETFNSVLEKAPNARWRALLVLARLGAVRVPSEVKGLRWDDIAWEAKRITIRSPKTEHHVGKDSRIIPLYPQLETELVKLFAEADDKAEYVFPNIKANSNLRTTLERIIARAGVTQWPKLWQNLRASGATDLARSLPSHVAAAICGHSVEVAQEHYWTVASTDLDAAIAIVGSNPNPKQNPKQQASAGFGTVKQTASPCLENAENRVIPWELHSEKWARRDSNPRHLLCKSSALTN